MHVAGSDQWAIAEELGCTQSRVSQLIKEAAKANPVVSLSYEERAALAEAKWVDGEREIKQAIEEQRQQGRITREVIRFPDGTEQVKVTKVEGVDPALLRTLSTHTDRRNRQAQNQLAPDSAVSQVNVQLVQDLMGQSSGAAQSLSPSEWNNRQNNAVDV